SHFVLTRAQQSVVPSVGTVTKYWDIVQNYNGFDLVTEALRSDEFTVTAVDANAGIVTRTRASDTRVDTFRTDFPIAGLRFRESPALYQRMLPGLGITASIDGVFDAHFFAISVMRP